MTDSIKYEIQQLQNKILELEQLRIQKEAEVEEEKVNLGKQTFGYYFDKLFDFITMKNDHVNQELNRKYPSTLNYTINEQDKHYMNLKGYDIHPRQKVLDEQRNRYRIQIIKQHNAEYVSALEHIYGALYNINERLNKLENL